MEDISHSILGPRYLTCLKNANVPNEDVSSTYIVFFDPKLALQRISLDMFNVNKALFATKKCDTEAK